MTAPEDQNGLREALAMHFDGSAFQPAHSADQYWGQRRRDAYRRADALIAGPLASLIADRASLRAAEAEITRLKEGMEALGAALKPLAEEAERFDRVRAAALALPDEMVLPSGLTLGQARAARQALAIQEQPHG